jgi:DNA-binding LytR/AlgR family response regulator
MLFHQPIMKLDILIVDDEYAGRNTLINLLKRNCAPYTGKIDAVANLDEAKQHLLTQSYHVLFLDIRLDQQSGFDLLPSLSDETKVIIVTAYSDYAIEAIKKKAFDYFLKPVTAEELKKCVLDCYQRIQPAYKQYLTIKFNGMTVPLELHEVLMIKAKGPYSEIMLENGSLYVTSQTLKSLEPKLDGRFFRVHKSFIVNRTYIKGFNQKELYLNSHNIPLSRNGLAFLQKFYAE